MGRPEALLVRAPRPDLRPQTGVGGDLGHQIWGRGRAIPPLPLDRPGGGLGSTGNLGGRWWIPPQCLGGGGGLLFDPHLDPVQGPE